MNATVNNLSGCPSQKSAPLMGKSIFGATWEEFPAPKNRIKVGSNVLLKQFGSARRYPAKVLEVCPGGRIRFADGEVTEGTDTYHLRIDDEAGNLICLDLSAHRHDFTVVRHG